MLSISAVLTGSHGQLELLGMGQELTHHLHTVLSFTSDDKVFMADFRALPAKLPISNQEGRKSVVSIISCSCRTDGRDDLRERFYIEVVQQRKEHMATFFQRQNKRRKFTKRFFTLPQNCQTISTGQECHMVNTPNKRNNERCIYLFRALSVLFCAHPHSGVCLVLINNHSSPSEEGRGEEGGCQVPDGCRLLNTTSQAPTH